MSTSRPTPSTGNGDAYAQDATTVTSAGPSTSLTNKTSSPRNASNKSPTTALTDVHVLRGHVLDQNARFDEVQPLTTLQLTGQCGRIHVGLFLHSPNLDHGPQDSCRSHASRCRGAIPAGRLGSFVWTRTLDYLVRFSSMKRPWPRLAV